MRPVPIFHIEVGIIYSSVGRARFSALLEQQHERLREANWMGLRHIWLAANCRIRQGSTEGKLLEFRFVLFCIGQTRTYSQLKD